MGEKGMITEIAKARLLFNMNGTGWERRE